MANPRVFLPFGEFLPDRRQLSNKGLLRAFGVVPLAGNYIQAPQPAQLGMPLLSEPAFGFGLHSAVVSGARKLYGYYGSAAKLYELDYAAFSQTDRSRLAGGAYAFSSVPPSSTELWWFASYGTNVIATNFEDAVQVLSTPGSGNFVDLFTSTWKPQARFAFPIRQNLFFAYIFSPTNYDTVTAGTHPQLVAWTMNDTPQSIGSLNVDPAFIGAGYNPLNNDFGPITAAIGGDFGLVFQVGGIVRIDGPPYEFRAIAEGDSTLYPYSVFRLGDDIYFWGNAGPSVLRGGEAPVERLGLDKLQRSLLDNSTGFGADFARALSMGPREVSAGADPVNELMRWSYPPVAGAELLDSVQDVVGFDPSTLLVDYNDAERRFAVSPSTVFIDPTGAITNCRHYFLRNAPLDEGGGWGPFRTVYGLAKFREAFAGTEQWRPHSYELQLFSAAEAAPPEIILQTGFGRLNDQNASRIIAVRPVWTATRGEGAGIAAGLSVSIHTKNKPYEDDTSAGPFTVINEDGWVGTPDSVVGSYHSVTLQFSDTTENERIHEIEGLEIEYLEGGAFGA